MLDKNYWKNRWQTGATGWDAGESTTPIREFVDYLVQQNTDKNTRILIPGAGSGHEAVYFFRQGFRNITVCDWAEEAIEKLKKQLPELPESQLIVGDFFDIKGIFDIIIEQTFFCAIDPILRPKYVQKCFDLLDTEGVQNHEAIEARQQNGIFGVLFSQNFETAGPPFGGTKEEYIQYFDDQFDILKMEACRNSIKPRLGTELWVHFKKK
jgi:methyl halide transferase